MTVIGLLVLMQAALHASPAQNTSPEPPATVRRALLVGIEAYPEATGWPKLSGPRADVLAVGDGDV